MVHQTSCSKLGNLHESIVDKDISELRSHFEEANLVNWNHQTRVPSNEDIFNEDLLKLKSERNSDGVLSDKVSPRPEWCSWFGNVLTLFFYRFIIEYDLELQKVFLAS